MQYYRHICTKSLSPGRKTLSTFYILNKCSELYFACSNQKKLFLTRMAVSNSKHIAKFTESLSKIKLFEPQDANEKMNNSMMVNAHRTS